MSFFQSEHSVAGKLADDFELEEQQSRTPKCHVCVRGDGGGYLQLRSVLLLKLVVILSVHISTLYLTSVLDTVEEHFYTAIWMHIISVCLCECVCVRDI